MDSTNAKKRPLKKLLNKRGAVTVEYTLILLAVVVPAVAGLVAGGKMMYDGYKTNRTIILLPIP